MTHTNIKGKRSVIDIYNLIKCKPWTWELAAHEPFTHDFFSLKKNITYITYITYIYVSRAHTHTVIVCLSHLPPAIAPNVWTKMLAVNRIQLWTNKCQCRRLLQVWYTLLIESWHKGGSFFCFWWKGFPFLNCLKRFFSWKDVWALQCFDILIKRKFAC